jgi:hypothetical protein
VHSEIRATKRHKREEILKNNNNNNQMLDGMHSNTSVLKRIDNSNHDDPEVVTSSAPDQEMVKVQNPNSANLFVINIATLSFDNMQSSLIVRLFTASDGDCQI